MWRILKTTFEFWLISARRYCDAMLKLRAGWWWECSQHAGRAASTSGPLVRISYLPHLERGPAAGRCGAVWSLIPFVCKFKRFLSRLLYCVLLTKATNSVKPFLYLSLSILIINNNGLKASNNDLKPLCPHLLLYHLEGNLLNTSLFYLCSGKVQWLSIVLRYGSGSGSGQLL